MLKQNKNDINDTISNDSIVKNYFEKEEVEQYTNFLNDLAIMKTYGKCREKKF